MRQAAYSISTNVDDGSGRNSNAELKHFITISNGSAAELEYQIILHMI
jgi:four helix bundle protein